MLHYLYVSDKYKLKAAFLRASQVQPAQTCPSAGLVMRMPRFWTLEKKQLIPGSYRPDHWVNQTQNIAFQSKNTPTTGIPIAVYGQQQRLVVKQWLYEEDF